jgi:hypothetical protein
MPSYALNHLCGIRFNEAGKMSDISRETINFFGSKGRQDFAAAQAAR